MKVVTTKTELLYRALLPMKVASFDDIIQKASSIVGNTADRRYIYRKYIKRLIESGKLKRVRKQLYMVLSPLEDPERPSVDKFLIASRIRDNYYLGYQTALEHYGCASSLYNEAHVSVKAEDRFDPFQFDRFSFIPIFVKDVTLEVVEKPYRESVLRVSSKERTFIECIDRVKYAGGWEECIKSLEGLGGLNFERLLNLLRKYENQSLSRRVGYVLELLKERSPFYEHLDVRKLEEIEEMITGSPRYLISGEKGPLNTRWQLYIPDDFEERLRGI